MCAYNTLSSTMCYLIISNNSGKENAEKNAHNNECTRVHSS